METQSNTESKQAAQVIKKTIKVLNLRNVAVNKVRSKLNDILQPNVERGMTVSSQIETALSSQYAGTLDSGLYNILLQTQKEISTLIASLLRLDGHIIRKLTEMSND